MTFFDQFLKAINFSKTASISTIAADGGTRLIKTTPVTGLEASAVFIREATVISTLSGVKLGDPTNATVNFLTTMGLTGETLNAGELYRVPRGYIIKAITCGSGSLIAIS